ncbi:MAG: BamA/TamA family outer membrane protein [bacterium]
MPFTLDPTSPPRRLLSWGLVSFLMVLLTWGALLVLPVRAEEPSMVGDTPTVEPADPAPSEPAVEEGDSPAGDEGADSSGDTSGSDAGPDAPAPAPEESAPGSGQPIIREIEFRGNRRVTDDLLLQVMRLRPGMRFSALMLNDDLRRIGELGFFSAPPEPVNEAVEGGVRIIIYIQENPAFKDVLVEIVQGPGLFPTGELAKAFVNNLDHPLVPGELMSADQMASGIKAVEEVYRDKGYTAATVMDKPVEMEGENAGRVTLKINEGVISEVRIEGNTKTSDEVIWREITIKPGDVFSAIELNNIRRKLYNLQLFDEITPAIETTDDYKLILILKFTEARTGQLGFGVGYSSQDGILGTISFAERNFRGKGQTLRATGQIGGPNIEGTFSYFMPHVDARGSSVGIELFRQSFTDTERDPDNEDLFASYDTRRTGGEVKYIYPLGPDLDASVGLKFLHGNITLNPESTADLLDVSEFARRGLLAGTSNSATIGVTRDTRDYPLDPSGGSTVGVTAAFFGGALGGDFDAIKITGEFKRYWRLTAAPNPTITAGPIETPTVLALRILAGGTYGNLSLLDRFELGGSNSIRGLDFAAQTGDKSVLANLEYRFPVMEDMSGAVFLDAGTAASPGDSLDFGNLLTSIGLGIRYRIPFLGAAPLRIDYGYDLDGGDAQVVLGFGQLF